MADRSTRTIAPYSSITVSQYVVQQVEGRGTWSPSSKENLFHERRINRLIQALHISPNDAKAQVQLALAFRQRQVSEYLEMGDFDAARNTLDDLDWNDSPRVTGTADPDLLLEYFEAIAQKRESASEPFDVVRGRLLPVGLAELFARVLVDDAVDLKSVAVFRKLAKMARESAGDAWIPVPAFARWKYADDGGQPDSSWASPGFDDNAWGEGEAPLGFGDPVTTTIRRDADGSGQSGMSFYFRHSFHLLEAPETGQLYFRVRRDDGVAVHLNGTELFRENLPEGVPLTSQTAALKGVAAAEEKLARDFAIDLKPGRVNSGRNVLAAEVHQDKPSSSDVRFELEMSVRSVTASNYLSTLDPREIRSSVEKAIELLPDTLAERWGDGMRYVFAGASDSGELRPQEAKLSALRDRIGIR